MSETKNLKLFKHDEPLETNENQFNIKKALHDNWDKLDEFGGKVNAKTVEIENKQKQHDTDISNIKQEQQEQNLKIESNTTESKDNTELLNQIMGLLPSAKGEGENVTLDDTAEARFKKFAEQGNSKQETRSGKNAIKSLNRRAKRYISWVLDKSKLEKKMYFSLIASKDLNSTNSIFFNVIDGSLTAINKYAMAIKANVKSIRQIDFTEEELNTLKNSDKDIILQIYENNAEIDCTTITFSEVMLANSNNTDYEQYGASPSLEFPSKIRNVGDNINLYSKDNANILNTMIDTQGLGVNAGDTYKTIYIPCKPNTTYTVSKLYDATKNRFALGFTDTEPTYSMKVEGYITNANVSDLTITTGANAKYLLAYIWITGGTTTYKEMLNSIKIEEGTQATAYSQYNRGNTEVIVCNKNLAVSDFEQYYNSPTAGYVLCPLKLKKGSTYKFTAKLTGVNMVGLVNYGIVRDGNSYEEFVNNASFVLDLSGKIFDKEFTIDDKFIAPKLVCWAKTEDIFNNLFKNYEIQLVEKTNTDSFVQHKQQTIVFPFTEGQRLCKGDYLAEDGIHHTRKKIVLDGTEAWGQYNRGTTDFFGVALKVSDIKSGQTIMCNKLIEDGSKIYSTNGEAVGCLTDNYLYICIKRVRIGATINTTFEECLELFKQYLTNCYNKGEPFIIEYGLINEENEPYTPEQQEAHNQLKKLHSYNEQTNIFSKDEINPIFNVEAIKNLNVAVLEQTTKES